MNSDRGSEHRSAGDCLPGVAGGISCSAILAGVTAVGAVTVVTAPGSASDASAASVGESGETDEPAVPESADPPLLICTIGYPKSHSA